LREFGAPMEGLTAKNFAEEGNFFQMGIPPMRVDILMGIPGARFEDCWQRRNEIYFDDLPVDFTSKKDLIMTNGLPVACRI
jgi:hypothetical protein